MWSLKISRRLASRKSSKRRSGAAQFRLPLGQRRFGIEPLEQRTLLTTGTISVVSGVLTIASGAGQNNALTIGLDASTATIDISDGAGNNYNISGISNTTGSGTNFITIPVASVLGDNIAVATLDGSDSLTVNLANGNPAPGGTITYTSTTGTKALTVEEGTLPTGDTLSVTSAAISGTAIPFTVDYSTTGGTFGGGVTLTSAAVNDTVNILSTLSGVDYNIKAGGGNNSALNFTGDATQNVTVDIGAQTVQETTFGLVTFTGVDTANVANGTGAATVEDTATGNTLAVTPTAANASSLQVSGQPLSVNVTASASPLNVSLAANDALLVNGSQYNDAITVTGTQVADTETSGPAITLQTIAYTGAASLVVNGNGGNDTFTVTPGATPISVEGPSAGSDTLALTGTASANDAYVITPGPDSQSGTAAVTLASSPTTTVSYSGIENVAINGGGGTGSDSITLDGTGGNDVFTVTAGGVGATTGTATVDGGPAISFTELGSTTGVSGTSLVLNQAGGSGGSDAFILTQAATTGAIPNVTVNGGTSASVTINGTAAADTFGVTPASASGAKVVVNSATTYTVSGAAALAINGQGGSDALTFNGSGGGDTITSTPGAATDSGTLQDNSLLALSYQNLGAATAVNVEDTGSNNTLVVNGTAANDAFVVAATTGDVQVNSQLPLAATGFQTLTLNGLAGDNTYSISAPQSVYTAINVNGSGLPDPDVVNLTGSGAAAATVTLAGNGTGAVTGGGLGTVEISGVGIVNLNNSGAGVTVADGGSNNTLLVTPTAAQSATSQISGQAPVVNTISAASLAVTLASSDQLVVNGSQYNDTITVTGAQVADTETSGPALTLQTIAYSGAASLTVNGNDGNDTFNVTPGATPILVDGGNPVGVQPGDVFNLNAGGGGVTFYAGPTGDSGGFQVGSSASVSFVHIETIGAISNPGNVTVDGTNGDDDITIIARDSTYSPLADGIQDFTVSVNAGPQILYVNAANLTVNSLSGDDDIVLQTPAPNGAAWNVQVTINGGAPQTLGGRLGDTFSLETPDGATAAQTVAYTPTGPNSGTLNDSTLASLITLTDIEQVFYNGGANGDALTFNGTGGNDTITSTPGATTDSGILQDNSLLALNYQNLGPATAIAIQDTGTGNSLVVDGIGSNDTYAVSTGGSGFLDQVKLDKQLPLQTNANITSLTLNGSGLPDPNIANLTGATGLVTVNLADSTIPTNTTITGYGGTVTLIGVDVCNLNAGGFALTAIGTAEDDDITYTPTGAAAGTFQDAGLSTVFNFTNVTGSASPFTIEGGGGIADEVTVDGTTARDLFEIDQGARTVQVLAYDTTPLKTVTLDTGIETVTALGLLGEDTFQVIPNASVSIDNLIVNVDGGDPASNNALVVGSAFAGVGGGAMPALPASEFAVVSRSATPNSGTVRVFANGSTQFPDINYQNVATVAPQVYVAGPNGLNPNLLVMGPDPNEPNDSQGAATFLGSGATLQVQNATIFPAGSEYPGVPADQDYYQVVAQTTGTLDFQVYFHLYPGLLPGNGALDLEAFDAAGDLIAEAVTTPTITPTFGALGATADARVRIPVVAGQSYFLLVYGAASDVVNGYNMTVINTAPPVPFDLELSRSALSVTINTPGSGYTSTPTVTFSGGGAGATQATGIADMFGDTVMGVTLTSNGSGYTSAPIITFSGGGAGATQATATASLTDVGNLPPSAANDDTGRSQFDNVTYDNLPTIYIQLADGVLLNDLPGNGTTNSPPAGVISIPYSPNESTAGFRVAIFDGNNSQTPVGYATAVGSGFPGLYQYTFTAPLADGLHNITAAVQMIDPATPTETGFGGLSTALAITVDTVPPPVFFGSSANGYDGLAAASDSGVQGYPATNVDRVTNDTTPTFWGTAEADAIVRVYAVGNVGDVLLGQTTATPLDGTNADPDGQWSLTSTVDLNNPAFFPHDGTRYLLVTAEDLAGNVSAASTMMIFVDTSGPQISNVQITGSPGYNLFGEKTANPSSTPTPLVYSLTISVVDNPARDTANFPNYLALLIPTPVVTITGGGSGYSSAPAVTFSGGGATMQATGIAMIANGMVTGVEITSSGTGYTSAPTVTFSGGGYTTAATATAVLQSPGNIVLQGEANGIIAISSVVITDNPPVNGQPATATVQLNFATPLPDDLYTLTIEDTALMDPAGNLLDGESNAAEPNGAPMFPSGNGVPGGISSPPSPSTAVRKSASGATALPTSTPTVI